jgi:hypothetical protein
VVGVEPPDDDANRPALLGPAFPYRERSGVRPCEVHHRLQLRVGMPDRYVSWESMRDLVPQVKDALGVPPDEPYLLAGLSQQTSTEEPQFEFVSTTRWQPPG